MELSIRSSDFEFTEIVSGNRLHLDENRKINDILNHELSIKNYTAAYDMLLFTYILVAPQFQGFYKEGLSASKTKRRLYLEMFLDNEAFTSASSDEALHIMVLLYLKGIEIYLSKRKDFDWKRFYNDCEKALEPLLQTSAYVY